MTTAYVRQLFTGKVKQAGDPNATSPMDKPWESGIFKTVTKEQTWASETGLIGDEVADKKTHGGPEKAIFSYPIKHYDYWKKDLGTDAIDVGGMGENLAVLDIDESSVCIGDTYRFGDALLQVSQPRRPCWKPARRFQTMDLALRIQNSGRTGWYFRVLQEGYVRAGVHLELIERPYPEWTIQACNNVMYIDKDNLQLVEKLASCELLATNWKRTLNKRILGQSSSSEKRVYGPNKH
ncbi:MOSC domain-containing protein [Salicibibacter cibi]|uniref:MOSC domain-containing protein n=1 Tax=Salicibibacter cibi TaxID=2743001 RepID=A0A7T7CE43_9BACI|nr:MOSC domain-containing protein [Salicibibacter cibi]QQK78647.1 MOSC domain-containing protein [Salicibibacter cibi]